MNRLLTGTLIALFLLPATAHAADDGTYTSATVSPASLTASTGWGDANGDGKADYCRVTAEGQPTGQYSCTFSTGHGFGATTSTPGDYDAGYATARLWGDVTGDGRPEYCRRVGLPQTTERIGCTTWGGTAFIELPQAGMTWGADTGVALADANGDGKADFCRVIGTSVQCTLSTGSGFGTDSTPLSVASDNGGQATGRAWVDADGDHKAEYCRVSSATNIACTSSTMNLSVNVADTGPADGRVWADVNGDGKADYCRRWGSPTPNRLACAMGPDFRNNFISAALDFGDATGEAWVDFDGDGDLDYCRPLASGKLACTPWEAGGLNVADTVTSAPLNTGLAGDDRAWVDFNGDHKADYCRRVTATTVACTTSTGTGFGPVADPVAPVAIPAATPKPQPAAPAPAPAPAAPAAPAAIKAPLPRIAVTLVYAYSSTRTATKFSKLTLTGIPAGATVTATASKPKKSVVKTSASSTLSLTGLLHTRFKVGARLTITVAKAGMTSATKTVTIRAHKAPAVTTS